eukprot:1160014-Pelagomonas_calceolata.AAC.2
MPIDFSFQAALRRYHAHARCLCTYKRALSPSSTIGIQAETRTTLAGLPQAKPEAGPALRHLGCTPPPCLDDHGYLALIGFDWKGDDCDRRLQVRTHAGHPWQYYCEDHVLVVETPCRA